MDMGAFMGAMGLSMKSVTDPRHGTPLEIRALKSMGRRYYKKVETMSRRIARHGKRNHGKKKES